MLNIMPKEWSMFQVFNMLTAADQNVNVHDVALSGKKNACYVVLVLNYRLVTVKKKKKSMPIYPIHLFLQQSPL